MVMEYMLMIRAIVSIQLYLIRKKNQDISLKESFMEWVKQNTRMEIDIKVNLKMEDNQVKVRWLIKT